MILEKLLKIQKELKAPKNQRNNFGNYNYRSNEDILEAVKQLAHENGCIVTQEDELVNIGDRYYVKATTTLIEIETSEKQSATAYAREEENKKGMDGSQITGASSSYARKYSANGLFAIDDTKDSDGTNTHGKETKQSKDKILANKAEIDLVNKLVADIPALLNYYKIEKLEDLTSQQAKQIIERKQNEVKKV